VPVALSTVQGVAAPAAGAHVIVVGMTSSAMSLAKPETAAPFDLY
jgi:hypothetical protein